MDCEIMWPMTVEMLQRLRRLGVNTPVLETACDDVAMLYIYRINSAA